MVRKIEYRLLAQLRDDERNPKDHDVQMIDASVARFGVLDVMVVDGRTDKLISGHGRKDVLEGMEAREESPPSGVKVDDQGRWLVPVVTGWASVSDTESGAALLAANKTVELGGWQDEQLLELLDEIAAEGNNFTGVGFSEMYMENLRAALDAAEKEPEDSDEDEPETQEVKSLRIQVRPSVYNAYRKLKGATDGERIEHLLTSEEPVAEATQDEQHEYELEEPVDV